MPANESYRHELPRFDRVRRSTPKRVNDKIDRETEERVASLREAPLSRIEARIGELEREWDVDRALMATFPILGGAVLLSALRFNRKLFALLGVQMSFLLYHAVRGWCPPASVFRRLGFRTVREIDAEKAALEAILRKWQGSGLSLQA